MKEETLRVETIQLPKNRYFDTFITKVNALNDGNTVFKLSLILEEGSIYKDTNVKKLTFGVSSRNCKIFCKPMIEILHRLCVCLLLDIIIIPDDVVRQKPIEYWPIVDIFLCFYASGFPMNKAIEYARLRKPFLINDLEKQKFLNDRKHVYETLSKIDVAVPNFIIVERDPITNAPLKGEITEDEEAIYYDGRKMMKPVVEKPLNAENHNINIYFPNNVGGGVQKMFRKMGNRSSFYCKKSPIRKRGSYLYEEFLFTEGADVKIYCVGPEYAHAEARKSPALDGKVERDHAGNEMRYPIILTSAEKNVARTVVEVFGQNMCGMDILRMSETFYVCDVNGFSFVKKSTKYYDDCAQMLVELILTKFGRACHVSGVPVRSNLEKMNKGPSIQDHMLELVSVIGIIRHGDRTPKQKMKMLTNNDEFFKIFQKYNGLKKGRIKLKKPQELQEVLDVTNTLLFSRSNLHSSEVFDNPQKLFQMKYVLEMYGEFMGINRKIQIKSLRDDRNKVLECKFRAHHPDRIGTIDFSEPMLLLILKWGGELTEVGRTESEEFGQWFADLYPFKKHDARIPTVCNRGKLFNGLLRLHSTYRHSMKVTASDEGRVQLTAAAFARGMLSLESNLAPILVHLVKCDEDTTKMLDISNQVEYRMVQIKNNIQAKLSVNKELDDEFIDQLTNPTQLYFKEQLKIIKNPFVECEKIHSLVINVSEEIGEIFGLKHNTHYLSPNSASTKRLNTQICHGESPELLYRRWIKLARDFKMKDGHFDMSLIPDIYDCARYDYFHNIRLGIKSLPELYEHSRTFSRVVISQEYGISIEEKLSIGRDVCDKILRKISSDLQHDPNASDTEGNILDADGASNITSPNRRVRTRLYFTSESHIYCLMNILRHGNIFSDISKSQSIDFFDRIFKQIDNIPEYDFLSNIIIMQYEDRCVEKTHPDRFQVEILFCSGIKRTTPITIPRQLTRPAIKFESKSVESTPNHKSKKISKCKDDSSANFLSRTNSVQPNDDSISRLMSKNYHEFENSEFSRSAPVNSPTNFSSFMDTKNQLRKPNSKSNFMSSRFIKATQNLSELHALGPLVSKNSIVEFINKFLS